MMNTLGKFFTQRMYPAKWSRILMSLAGLLFIAVAVGDLFSGTWSVGSPTLPNALIGGWILAGLLAEVFHEKLLWVAVALRIFGMLSLLGGVSLAWSNAEGFIIATYLMLMLAVGILLLTMRVVSWMDRKNGA